jgi:hypothetical protein
MFFFRKRRKEEKKEVPIIFCFKRSSQFYLNYKEVLYSVGCIIVYEARTINILKTVEKRGGLL